MGLGVPSLNRELLLSEQLTSSSEPGRHQMLLTKNIPRFETKVTKPFKNS